MSLESENFAGGGRTDIRGVLRGPKGGRGGQPRLEHLEKIVDICRSSSP